MPNNRRLIEGESTFSWHHILNLQFVLLAASLLALLGKTSPTLPLIGYIALFEASLMCLVRLSFLIYRWNLTVKCQGDSSGSGFGCRLRFATNSSSSGSRCPSRLLCHKVPLVFHFILSGSPSTQTFWHFEWDSKFSPLALSAEFSFITVLRLDWSPLAWNVSCVNLLLWPDRLVFISLKVEVCIAKVSWNASTEDPIGSKELFSRAVS